jgi:hypothetical protein
MMRIAALTGATVMGGLLLATLPVSIQWSAERTSRYLRTRPMRWLEGPQPPEA